ncbi:MAG TPA: hypothetical protein PK228_19720 [Saprospiraceae bacterium]|nr:hypothetical protein [Saprospiraceae bacterium]
MKHPLSLLFLLAATLPAFCQKLYPLQDTYDSLQFKITVTNRQIVLVPQGETSLFQAKKGFPFVNSVLIEEADLVLNYQPGKSKESSSYSIDLRLRLPDGRVIEPQPHEISDIPALADPNAHNLAWLDATEQLEDFEGTYTLYVKRTLMGAVNCEGIRPEFTLKKQLPHYAAGAAGVVLIGLGQVYRTQKEDYYDTYQRLWQEGEPAPGDNDDPFQKAKDKEKASNICTWTGVGILAADALLFVYRHLKIKGKQQTYDKFCGKGTSLTFEPAFQFSSSSGPNKFVPGFRIAYSF